jgi:hypothetical protein
VILSSQACHPPAAQTPAERQVVVAHAVANRQLVREYWSLDAQVAGGTTRQRVEGLVWQQTTVSGRPQVDWARS